MAELTAKRLVGGLVGFFGFLLLFLEVSNRLGGGDAGIAISFLAAVGFVGSFAVYLRRLDRVAEAASRRVQSRVAPESLVASQPLPKPVTKRVTPSTTSTPGSVPACSPGPWYVEPRATTWVDLDVINGSRVQGRLEETAEYDFEWMIVDEDERVRYLQGRKPRPAVRGEGEGAYKIDWMPNSNGPWFLCLEAYGKKETREVVADLRK